MGKNTRKMKNYEVQKNVVNKENSNNLIPK